MVKFFSRSGSSSGNLEDSVSDQSSAVSVNTPETSKKRIHSESPSSEDAKKPHLNLSPNLADKVNFEFDTDTPNWVIQLFTVCENMSSDIKTLSAKFDEFERFQSQITKRVETVEKANLNFVKKCEGIENQTNEVKKKVCSLDALVGSMNVKMTSFDTEKESMKGRLVELEKSAEFSSEIYEEMKKEFSTLDLANKNLLKTVELLQKQVDSNEQHNRNECLLLHGVSENPKETPLQSASLFVQTINTTLGLELNPNEIRRAHRLGKKRADGKPRPLIARFWSCNLRNNVYSKKKFCKGKSVSLTENLTKTRMHQKTDAEKKYGSGNVWTREGRIYAKDTSSDTILTLVS